MSILTKVEMLKFIKEQSNKLGITSYKFAQNTVLSDLGARNILDGTSKNPRRSNLIAMLDYIEKQQAKKGAVAEPDAIYHHTKELSEFLPSQIINHIYNNKPLFEEEVTYKLFIESEIKDRVIAKMNKLHKSSHLINILRLFKIVINKY